MRWACSLILRRARWCRQLLPLGVVGAGLTAFGSPVVVQVAGVAHDLTGPALLVHLDLIAAGLIAHGVVWISNRKAFRQDRPQSGLGHGQPASAPVKDGQGSCALEGPERVCDLGLGGLACR